MEEEKIVIKEYCRFTEDRYRDDVVKAIKRLSDARHDRLFRCEFAYYIPSTHKIVLEDRGE